MDASNGLDYILSLHGTRVNREDGYWWKIEAWKVTKTAFIPWLLVENRSMESNQNGFHSAFQLVEDFFTKIDEVISKRENRG